MNINKYYIYIVEQLFYFVWFENFDYLFIYDLYNKYI